MKFHVLLLLLGLAVFLSCAIAETELYVQDYRCDSNQCKWASPPPQRRHCGYGCQPKQTPFRGSRGPGVKAPPGGSSNGKAPPPSRTPELMVPSPSSPQLSAP